MRFFFSVVFTLIICCSNIERTNPFDIDGGNWNPPVVTVMTDSTVNINDSLTVTSTAQDDGAVVKYIWARNGSIYADTGVSCSLKVAYADSGCHVVRVKVIDNDGVESKPDSCVVKVTYDPPVVTISADSSVNINDSLTVTAIAQDNGTIVRYLWARTENTHRDTTASGTLRIAFADSGRHVVQVRAVDDDCIISQPSSCIIKVTYGAPKVIAMKDSSININNGLTVTVTGWDNGAIVKYIWALDGINYADSTALNSIRVAYADYGRHVVRVKAIDDDNIESQTDSCIVHVTLDPPVVNIVSKASVNIRDSLTLVAVARDNGSITKYFWARNGSNYEDTTVVCSLRVAYADYGKHVVYVKAIDDDGVVSLPDSCLVTVTLDEPVVTAMVDTSVDINDSLIVTATARDNGSIVKYLWASNGKTYNDTTVSGSLKVAYADTGRYVVRVKVVDDDGVVSLPDSCLVTVTIDAPVATAMADTFVDINDSLIVTATARDNGSIIKYLWASNGSTFMDTTASGSLKIAYSDTGKHVVRVKVLDNDGIVSKPDSCLVMVIFHAPVVTAMADASVNINDSLTVTATAQDNGFIVKYIWARNGTTFSDTTVSGALKVAYSASGRQIIRVKAIDDDRIESQPDSCAVTVTVDAH